MPLDISPRSLSEAIPESLDIVPERDKAGVASFDDPVAWPISLALHYEAARSVEQRTNVVHVRWRRGRRGGRRALTSHVTQCFDRHKHIRIGLVDNPSCGTFSDCIRGCYSRHGGAWRVDVRSTGDKRSGFLSVEE